MIVPLKLAYTTLPKDADEIQTTIVLMRHAVNTVHPSGLGKLETKLWAHVEAKLDGNPSEVELTVEQWKFVREAVDRTTFPPNWSRLAETLYDAMDEVEQSV